MTAASKTTSFTALRARLNLGGLELYDAPGLVAELRRLRTRYAAGAASVVNPRAGGSHGDLAQALALAVYDLDRHGVGGDRYFPQLDVERRERAVPALTAGLADRDAGFASQPHRTRRWYDDRGLIGKRF
jgi:hypothetical protein